MQSIFVAIQRRRCLVVQPQSSVIPEGCSRESAVAVSNPLSSHGFTLVELITVILGVIILSLISAPIYQNYTKQSIMTEGYVLIGAIRSAQDNYFSEYSTYIKSADSTAGASEYTSYDKILGINARMNNFYTLFNINNGKVDISEGFECEVLGSKGGNITLKYNRTTGVTVS